MIPESLTPNILETTIENYRDDKYLQNNNDLDRDYEFLHLMSGNF